MRGGERDNRMRGASRVESAAGRGALRCRDPLATAAERLLKGITPTLHWSYDLCAVASGIMCHYCVKSLTSYKNLGEGRSLRASARHRDAHGVRTSRLGMVPRLQVFWEEIIK